MIPADEISGVCMRRRNNRLVALTRDNDEGHVYSAGAEHSEGGESVKVRSAIRAEHDVPFLGERSSHPRRQSATAANGHTRRCHPRAATTSSAVASEHSTLRTAS